MHILYSYIYKSINKEIYVYTYIDIGVYIHLHICIYLYVYISFFIYRGRVYNTHILYNLCEIYTYFSPNVIPIFIHFMHNSHISAYF